jgi:hypothetical protein
LEEARAKNADVLKSLRGFGSQIDAREESGQGGELGVEEEDVSRKERQDRQVAPRSFDWIHLAPVRALALFAILARESSWKRRALARFYLQPSSLQPAREGFEGFGVLCVLGEIF